MAKTLDFNDILDSAPLEAPEPLTKIFTVNDNEFAVTISRAALTDAEAFYRACEISGAHAGDEGKKIQPMKVVFPAGRGKQFTLTSPAYIGSLTLLSELVSEPRLSPDQWAMAGNKFGPRFIAMVASWASKENGLVDPEKVDKDKLKDESDPKGMTPTENDSLAPA